MYQKTKSIFLASAFIVASLVTAKIANAFGERGCVLNPENIRGLCEKNVEGTWDCYEYSGSYGPGNCTSSD